MTVQWGGMIAKISLEETEEEEKQEHHKAGIGVPWFD